MESMRDLRFQVMEDLLSSMRDLNRRKSGLREGISQTKLTLNDRQGLNSRIYEAIRNLEENIFELQRAIKDGEVQLSSKWTTLLSV